MQKQPFLVQLLVWVADWLWALHKVEPTKQPFFVLLLRNYFGAVKFDVVEVFEFQLPFLD
jgi:hypothetical protein